MSTLYENIKALCNERGISGGKMCLDIGASKSLMTGLKNGRTKSINMETAQKIANYFNVSTDRVLYGKEDIKKEPPTQTSEEFDVSEEGVSRLLDNLTFEELVELQIKIANKLKERGIE